MKTIKWTSAEEQRIQKLGVYNAERYRGLVHTDEWKKTMKLTQKWFDARLMETYGGSRL